jgi:hypothetical protein
MKQFGYSVCHHDAVADMEDAEYDSGLAGAGPRGPEADRAAARRREARMAAWGARHAQATGMNTPANIDEDSVIEFVDADGQFCIPDSSQPISRTRAFDVLTRLLRNGHNPTVVDLEGRTGVTDQPDNVDVAQDEAIERLNRLVDSTGNDVIAGRMSRSDRIAAITRFIEATPAVRGLSAERPVAHDEDSDGTADRDSYEEMCAAAATYFYSDDGQGSSSYQRHPSEETFDGRPLRVIDLEPE